MLLVCWKCSPRENSGTKLSWDEVLWYAERDGEDSWSDWCSLDVASEVYIGRSWLQSFLLMHWTNSENPQCEPFLILVRLRWEIQDCGWSSEQFQFFDLVAPFIFWFFTSHTSSADGWKLLGLGHLSTGERATHRAAEVGNWQMLARKSIKRALGLPLITSNTARISTNKNAVGLV